jgi:hypothetical protein
VTSGGQVLVAPVKLTPGPAPAGPASTGPTETGQAAVYRWETSSDWYQPARRDASFVIAVTDPAAVAGGGLSVTEARALFGRPVAQNQVGQEVVMLYGYNLLTRVTGISFPGSG